MEASVEICEWLSVRERKAHFQYILVPGLNPVTEFLCAWGEHLCQTRRLSLVTVPQREQVIVIDPWLATLQTVADAKWHHNFGVITRETNLTYRLAKTLGLYLFSLWCFMYCIPQWQAKQQIEQKVLQFLKPPLWKDTGDPRGHVLWKGYVPALHFLQDLQLNKWCDSFCCDELCNAVICTGDEAPQNAPICSSAHQEAWAQWVQVQSQSQSDCS